MSKPSIEVVAGVIFDRTQQQILLAFRHPKQHQGDCWEFPGGKVEPNESQFEALSRELMEELDIEITNARLRLTQHYEYPEKSVCLHFFDVLDFEGQPTGKEGQPIQWFSRQDLAKLVFPEANQAVVNTLIHA